MDANEFEKLFGSQAEPTEMYYWSINDLKDSIGTMYLELDPDEVRALAIKTYDYISTALYNSVGEMR